MGEILETCVTGVNCMGRVFCEHAFCVFVQAGVLILVLLCVDLLLRKHIRATVRYWIWMLVFAKLLLPPDLSIPTGIGYWLAPHAPPAGKLIPPPVAETARDTVYVEPVAPAEMPALQPSYPASVVQPSTEPVESVAARSMPLTWQGVVFLLWCAGVLAFAGLVIRRWFFVKGLIAQGMAAPNDLAAVLDECRERMGVRRKVALRLSAGTFSPAVCGLRSPTILMPRELRERLSPENLRAVLIHELAHVKRRDVWVNCLQTALQIVYFYNPLVWLANAIVRRVREQAVDEMVLVALGAEARSYSTMLIDIAEMAFLRVSPALRLVGVAESRKSLEGRIRHMVARPMPKSARVGVIGAFVVVVTGAILLPMAAAGPATVKSGSTPDPANAVVTEFVGICNWATGKPVCWRPNGSPFEMAVHVDRRDRTPAPNDYEFIFHIMGQRDIDYTWAIDGAQASSSSTDVVDAQGNHLQGHWALTASMTEGLQQATVRVGSADGPWNAMWSHQGRGAEAEGGDAGGILWSQAFEDSEGVHIVASTPGGDNFARRVVAIDTSETMRVPSSTHTVSVTHIVQLTANFRDLKRDEIKEFQFQVRPYKWVAFENVSLRPGLRTEPRLGIQSAGPTTDELQRAIANSRMLSKPQALVGSMGKGCDVAIDSFKVAPGQTPGTYRAEVSIRNRSGVASPQIIVVFQGAREIDGPIHGAGPLKPDETWNEISDEFSLREGARIISVVLDPTDLIEETDETNNRAALRVVVKDGQIVEQSAVPAASDRSEANENFRVYAVNRSVADFPPTEDFSTPEAAYATINRMDQGDPAAWLRVDVARLADRMRRDGSERKRTTDPEWAKVMQNARIREVLVWNMTRAAVIAELPHELSSKKIVEPFDRRSFELENGRWLNTGNSRFNSIEDAKAQFMDWMQRVTASADVMRDPLRHANEIKEAAARLFEKLRTADYTEILSHYRDGKWGSVAWRNFPTCGLYTVHTDYPSFVLWCCEHFKSNPIVDVRLGDVFIGDALIADKTGWPTVPYKLTLADGTALAGNLPFTYEINQGQGHWQGLEGIDWHLWPNGTK